MTEVKKEVRRRPLWREARDGLPDELTCKLNVKRSSRCTGPELMCRRSGSRATVVSGDR